MDIEISATQKKRLEKIERLRKFFGAEDRPEIHEWSATDESIDFAGMSDREITDYFKSKG